jgi:hypothetical protein
VVEISAARIARTRGSGLVLEVVELVLELVELAVHLVGVRTEL